ncbi:MAG: hypothetical protein ACR2MD_05540 [Aridibacter sp.]
MSEQSSISKKSEMNPRTARAVAAILSQTRTDEILRGLNQSDGRNQSEQASFLAAESPFLRDIYERGGNVMDGVLIVPKENLTASPEIEIATTHAAVERLTRITKDADKAKELAPQFVEMGERIAGSNADGKTRLKVFGWLYRVLEGKQELLQRESLETAEQELSTYSEAQFAEKWQQIVELSEALAKLEPKDKLPENSLEAFGENLQETETAVERDEDLTVVEIYENADKGENSEHSEEFVSGGSLIGFERIETETDLPKIPENLFHSDFEKLLEKTADIDSQLERGASVREIPAPFKRYVEVTKLDNELRLVEEEYVKYQAKIIGGEKTELQNYRFALGREELRELAEERQELTKLTEQKDKLRENIQTNFSASVDREKVERSIDNQNNKSNTNNQSYAIKPEKIQLTDEEMELREVLVKEKSISREIDALSESISERENNFRSFKELSSEQITDERKRELSDKVILIELPLPSVLKSKYPELTEKSRNEKLTESNTFEIKSPAEYLFVREAANKHFQILRSREIKNEYRKFDSKNIARNSNENSAGREIKEHWGKIKTLKQIEPDFAYKIEGSSRIIKAEPSERAVAGYEFANSYIRYQLKQPETRARFESAVYREYAARLETAKTPQTLVREAYKIRQENHQAAGVWKNAKSEERQQLQRPLSKNEMTLLFLEQPPKSYTGEMSVLKYNFAHYSEAKTRMTAALEDGNLQPSAEAEKLVQSLEGRLNRRDLETKRKATRHFFESLQTENEKLVIKNEFDHRTLYQNLPPHEKDWIYRRATSQRENLEYKIEYDRQKNGVRDVGRQTESIAMNEVTASLRQEFAAGTLWHQAAELSNRIKEKNFQPVENADEKILQTVGFLIHNQPEANNLRVSDWLEKQKSEELKTAGEILKTFASATREIENNQMTVTVKIADTNRAPATDYKNLFERYFPADFEKIKEFRVKDNEKFRLEQSRRNGQTAILDTWAQEAQTAVYQPEAPVSVFENERRNIEEIEKIKAFQTECRRANEIKNAILAKYEEKLKKELVKSNRQISDADLRNTIEYAFTPEKSGSLSSEQKAIFEPVQNKILYSDFERFSENSNRLEKELNVINQSFQTIAALRLENSQYLISPEKTENINSLQEQYETIQKQSLIEQTTAGARQKFTAKAIDESNSPTKLIDYISGEEREQLRTKSHRQARIALEPVELNEPDKNSELEVKVLEFADALEGAHQSSLQQQSQSETATAFMFAETKREQLKEFSQGEKESRHSPEKKPVSLLIYERELARNERAIAQAKISQMVENGKLSLTDLETKKASEIFSPKEREEIRTEAGMRTRENLEPKELWAKRHTVSEELEQSALAASENLERAHEIYHDAGADSKEISRSFSALDADIIKLKNERQTEQLNAKFMNFKTEFKRDLATVFESGQSAENPRLLAAMTKGLLIDGLEKQNIQPEKIGISSEKLSEISLTISMAMTGDKKHEIFANKKFEPLHKTNTSEISERNNSASRQTEFEKQHTQVKPKQFERAG